MTVYEAFLAKVKEDDWARAREDLDWILQDWRSILNSALPYFKFPRCSFDIDEATQTFCDEKFSQSEVQVLAVYMKQEWLKRTIDSWENIKTQYEESDFSQANLLNTFIKLREQVISEAEKIEAIYYRSINRKPFQYNKLAGGRRRGRYNHY